jgi:hypothetical protein
METKEIIQLIKNYVACASYMCSLLKDAYDTKSETLLTARRMNIIPKNGVLKEGYKFDFHGGGCLFEFENAYIDVEFGPNDRCDGFDSFRLYNFSLVSKDNLYLSLKSEEIIKNEITQLLKDKVIIQPGLFPNPKLYYLNSVIYQSGNVSK